MKLVKTRDVKTPTRGTKGSAGIDFFIPPDFETKLLGLGDSVLIPSGIRARVPEGYALIADNKSGICTKMGLIVGADIIDSDYDGEIHIHLIKVTHGTVKLEAGMKIVQMLLTPISHEDIEEVETLPEIDTERGSGGFGSTGIR